MENFIYLDNAATTKSFDEVYDLMRQNNDESYYNPSASYRPAILAKAKLEEARKKINELLFGSCGKLYFTSSATESNNTVFCGIHLRQGQVVLISAGEHPSVYESAHRLENKGILVKDIPLDESGKVDFDKFKVLLNDKNVALVSIMHVSNETGAINDIKELVKFVKSVNPKIIFHSDGVQAFGKIKVNLTQLGVDLYTISAHKIYAPRGVGGLWVKNGIVIDPLLFGGGQEKGFRSSTENVAGAIAFAYSAERVCKDIDDNYSKVLAYKKKLLDLLLSNSTLNNIKVNSLENNSPYILSLSFDKIKGEVLMNFLESDSILISTGSACSSKKAGNRTLQSMGLSESEITSSVRISFSPYIQYDFEYISDCLIKRVLHLYKNVIVKK